MRRALVILVAVFLSACSENYPDPSICLSAPTSIEAGDWGGCVQKWAYRLAPSPDPVKVVAEVVVTGCAEAVAYQINEVPPDQRSELADSIMKSIPKTALFHVVQARAGHCEVP